MSIVSPIARVKAGNLVDLPSHTIHSGYVIDQKHEIVDHVMFLVMHAPRTFTGQHTVEITCHNNQFIIERIIELAIAYGARHAQEGEFTRRAFLNKKIDLVQAEAINELICANNQLALKKSLAQLQGSFSHFVIDLEEKLLKVLAFSEASFEFLDDEITFADQIREQLDHIINEVAEAKKSYNQQQQIRQGFRVAIIGSVNAGKSSLFNALLNRSRAIVTPIPGTTRDVLEAGMYVGGNYWTLVDTAGLRRTHDIIEQEGIKRAHDEAHSADVILLTFDSSQTMSIEETNVYQELLENYRNKIIAVANKADLDSIPTEMDLTPLILSLSKDQSGNTDFAKNFNNNICSVSSVTRAGIDQLQHAIEQKIAQILAAADSPFMLNKRQYHLLSEVEKRLQHIRSMIVGDIAYELLSYELKEALSMLSELTGKSVSEQAMDQVFRSFCVGK